MVGNGKSTVLSSDKISDIKTTLGSEKQKVIKNFKNMNLGSEYSTAGNTKGFISFLKVDCLNDIIADYITV